MKHVITYQECKINKHNFFIHSFFFHNIRQITNVMCNENDAFNDVWVHDNFNMIINVYINILH